MNFPAANFCISQQALARCRQFRAPQGRKTIQRTRCVLSSALRPAAVAISPRG
jgi:hypothetical protein